MNINIEHYRLIMKITLSLWLLVSGIFWLLNSSHAEETENAEKTAIAVSRPALTVRTTTLRVDKWAHTLEANGSIIPWQESVISAQVQGLRIAEVKVSIGYYVKQGDVLLTLDNFTPSSSDLSSPLSRQARIVAPDSGIISSASATVGSTPKSGAELFRLIRKGRLEWRPELTADELMLIRKGMTVEIKVGDGRYVKGKVRAISPSVDMQTRYGYALVSLPSKDRIVAGAFARGSFDISGGKKSLDTLPQSAVMQRGNISYVLVVGDDNHVHERPVITGQRKGNRVQIKRGLKANEPVIESGAPFLTEGDVVQVVKG